MCNPELDACMPHGARSRATPKTDSSPINRKNPRPDRGREPAKYVAKLRELKTNDTPLVFVVNMKGGHGGSSGRYDRYREVAQDYAFMLWQLGVE